MAAVVLEQYYGGNLLVVRVNKLDDFTKNVHDFSEMRNVIIVDIGLGTFDHHQSDEEKEKYEDGIPMAAVGKVWRHFGKKVAGADYVFNRMLDELIKPIELIDNKGPDQFGGKPVANLNGMVSDFVPNWNERKNVDEAFCEAFEFCKGVFERKLEKIQANWAAESAVKAMLDVSRETGTEYIVMEKFVPWKDLLPEDTNVLAAVHPGRCGYNWTSRDSAIFAAPAEICGKSASEICNYLAIPYDENAFIHPNGFCGGMSTKEAAVNMLKKILTIH